MEQFVKTTGIEITEGKVETVALRMNNGTTLKAATPGCDGCVIGMSEPIATLAPWVAWLKEYRTDRCRTGCNTLNGKIVVGEDGEVVYENKSWGRRP